MSRPVVATALLSTILMLAAGCGDKDKPAAPGTPGTPATPATPAAPAAPKAFTPATPWHEFKAADGSFTVQFPSADFKQTVEELLTANGTAEVNQVQWATPDFATRYRVRYFNNFTPPAEGTLRDLALGVFTVGVKEKIESGEVTRDGHKGYTASYATGKQFRQITRFFVGKHSIELHSTTANTDEGKAMAAYFAESLRILAKP